MRNTSLLLTWLYTHEFYDLVEIRDILTRDNKLLMHTLHLSMKHTEYYFIVYPKARQCPDLSVKHSKLNYMVVLQTDVDRYRMRDLHSNAKMIHRGRNANRTRDQITQSFEGNFDSDS